MRTEEFKLDGGQVLDKVKALIREGNIRRIVLKNSKHSAGAIRWSQAGVIATGGMRC